MNRAILLRLLPYAIGLVLLIALGSYWITRNRPKSTGHKGTPPTP